VPPELTFDGFAFRAYRGSALTADGWADRASFRRDTSDLAAERLRVRFPAEADRPESRMTAARGTGNLDARRFEARGDVHAEQAGRVADTEVARYSGQDGLVRGDRPVTVRGRGLTVSGPAFTLDPKDQVLRIEGGARAVSGGGAP
jgi:LPS export ABC transporter protein LptC